MDGEAAKLGSFRLEKTHGAMLSASKRTMTASGQAFVLFALCVVLTFGSAPNDRVKVPLLELTLDKWSAAEATLVLAVGAALRFQLLYLYYDLLRMKLERLLRKEGVQMATWSIDSPSIFTLSETLDGSHRRPAAFLSWLHITLVYAAIFALSVVLALSIGIRGGVGVGFAVSVALVGVLLAAGFAAWRLAPVRHHAEDLVASFDSYEKPI